MSLKRPLSVHSININQFERFKKDWDILSEENATVRADMEIECNGSISYVEHHRVKVYLDTSENQKIRVGYAKFPEFSVKNEDDFWKFMAAMVELDEDY